MSNKNFYELSTLNINKLICMIEALKIELIENMKKFEDILKVFITHKHITLFIITFKSRYVLQK